MGSLASNTHELVVSCSTFSCSTPLAATSYSLGTSRRNVNDALSDRWSLQGNQVRAPSGSQSTSMPPLNLRQPTVMGTAAESVGCGTPAYVTATLNPSPLCSAVPGT